MFTFAEIQRIFFHLASARKGAFAALNEIAWYFIFFPFLLWKAWNDKNRRFISFRIFLGHLLHHCQSACPQIYVRAEERRCAFVYVCESFCFVLQHNLSFLWPEMMMRRFSLLRIILSSHKHVLEERCTFTVRLHPVPCPNIIRKREVVS